MYTIDKTTYNKVGKGGYQNRALGMIPRSILDHTTNGKNGTTLHAEASYIMNSPIISSHYLIGKNGEIIEFLDPAKYIAWHAGCVNNTLYNNTNAIGIEMHNTPVEGHCTEKQLQALDWLVRLLLQRFDIPYYNVERHRRVAVYCSGHRLAGQLGRKIDPSGFPDIEFDQWRETLGTKTYKVINQRGVYVRQSPQVNDHNIAGTLNYNDTFVSDVLKRDETGQIINGSNLWAHILDGVSNGKPVDGLGFVHLSNLQLL